MAGAGLKPNTTPPSGPDADIGVYAAMIARARALIPQWRERASKTEDLRRLPSETGCSARSTTASRSGS